MLVSVNERTVSRKKPSDAVLETSKAPSDSMNSELSVDDDQEVGYQFIQEGTEKIIRKSILCSKQPSVRMNYDGITIEFYGEVATRKFLTCMEKVVNRYVSTR